MYTLSEIIKNSMIKINKDITDSILNLSAVALLAANFVKPNKSFACVTAPFVSTILCGTVGRIVGCCLLIFNGTKPSERAYVFGERQNSTAFSFEPKFAENNGRYFGLGLGLAISANIMYR